MLKRIFVAASSQHVGKTTCTLGLVAALREAGHRVGYCKPVGQEFVDLGDLRVDKDAILFSKFMDFSLEPGIHSPVILGSGATAAYLDNPAGFDFHKRILNAKALLEEHCDIVVYEGTGHPGVGSVVDLSNAEVANLLGAGVVLVVEGGIGNTIDRLSLCIAKFQQHEAPLIGVIINKVLPDKMEKVRYYVGRKLEQLGIPLLGVLPFDKTLLYPIMDTIKNAVNGIPLYNSDRLDNRVEETLAGSLIDLREIKSFSNLLLVVSVRRLPEAITKISSISKDFGYGCPLSGIVLTGDGRQDNKFEIDLESKKYIIRHKIPLVAASQLDTYGCAIKINRIEVKINSKTPWKTARAVELIHEHVNMDFINTPPAPASFRHSAS